MRSCPAITMMRIPPMSNRIVSTLTPVVCPECLHQFEVVPLQSVVSGHLHNVRTEGAYLVADVTLVPAELPVEPQSPYASSRADELAPRDPPMSEYERAGGAEPDTRCDPCIAPTCAHGYTVCKPCKFPAPEARSAPLQAGPPPGLMHAGKPCDRKPWCVSYLGHPGNCDAGTQTDRHA